VTGTPAIKRRELYPGGVVDGLPARNGALGRLRRQVNSLLVTRDERYEAELEESLRSSPGVTRPNVIALISPKGGVGKTTSTFLAGNLLASHLNLRVIAVDANPDFGTLGRLPGGPPESKPSLAELLGDIEQLGTAAELRRYVSIMPTGLHVLAAPTDPMLTAGLGPHSYGELLAFLSCFYDAILLDLGTGVTRPLARFAIERADQVVLVTTPEWITASVVLQALEHVHHEHTTVVVNKAPSRTLSELGPIDARLRRERLHKSVTIPQDEQLAVMLDSGTYALEALARRTRMPIKQLGLALAQQLV
jgi:MinD-like ATPase involved in chromosome partitioning or flagellar assembly